MCKSVRVCDIMIHWFNHDPDNADNGRNDDGDDEGEAHVCESGHGNWI